MIYTDLNMQTDVGASAHFVEIGGVRLLLDCGVHPKKIGADSVCGYRKILDDSLDFVALSHAHLDHVGALPLVGERQRFAEILASSTTCDLTIKMLRNSRSVMMRQKEELGIKEYPLFEHSQIDALKPRMLPMVYNRRKEFECGGKKISFEFFRAGHIPGASSIAIEAGKESLLYTGDISFHQSQLISGAEIPDRRFDVLIMETTRGTADRLKEREYKAECERFIDSVSRILNDGGSVLIPSFALGRMQEVVKLISKGMREKRIDSAVPVFASGLALDVSEYMVKETRMDSGINFDKHTYDIIRPYREKIKVATDFEQKGIYIFGSGMMVENTTSYLAASAMMENPQNAIFFVGYCDPDTPGGRLLKKAKGDTTFVFQKLGHLARTNCKIDKFDLSSHADRRELVDFALRCDPRTIVLTHGDEEARDWFMYELIDLAPNINVVIANPEEPVIL